MPTISHYEILEKLGEGGMGVVWKARDTRLERFLAIKLLPAAKTADPARRLRFVQEARAASALNHPRIITIYDIDRSEDGADFIAMEFVPGRTLDQLVPAKGLRINEALKYAIQIADALAAAHAAGIVHRDLKPANVMVTEKGDVKVLDFGLAKLMDKPTITEVDNTRTVAPGLPHTEEGTILGTASYMSPEQAEGKKVDARSDVFAFGLLLYEMLTGHRAFQAESKIATLAAILNLEPEPLEKLNSGVPRELVRVVQRCLRKDPDRRAHSMQDLKLALEEIKEDSDSGLIGAKPTASPARRIRQPILIAALGAILVAGGVTFWLLQRTPRIEAPLKAVPLTTFPGYEASPSFSPDGTQLAFSWDGEQGDNYDIYVQLIGSGRPLRLTTDAARDLYPVWSRDGKSIAFARLDSQRNVSIMQIPALGGAEREVAKLGTTATSFSLYNVVSDWSQDGRWLVTSNRNNDHEPFGLSLLSLDTGEKRRLTTAPPGYTGDFGGIISPDGRTMAFIRIQRPVGPGAAISDVFTIPLTAELKAGGEPIRLTSDGTTVGGISWAADGSEIVFSSSRVGAIGLWRVAVSSPEKPQRVAVGENAYSVAISHRANRLIYEQSVSRDTNIWRLDLTDPASPPTRFISSTRQDESPVYSPDGKRIAFRSDRSGTLEVWTCNADGSNQSQLTTRPTSGSPRWSPDSSQIAFDSTVDGRWQVFVVPAGGGQPRQLTSRGGTRPGWSHDGKWIYFASVQSGRSEVWKTPVSGGNAVQVSKKGGNNPQESEDGAWLFYNFSGTILKSAPDGAGEINVAEALGDNPFALTRDGIYYQAPPPAPDLRFFSFTSAPSRVIMRRSRPVIAGVSISPDGRWLLYSQIDSIPGSDLMLVENFR